MQAITYGYWVSEKPAAQLPQTSEYLKQHPPPSRGRVRCGYAAIAMGAALGLLGIVLLVLGLISAYLAVYGGVSCVVGIVLLGTGGAIATVSDFHKRLQQHPWQAWPCFTASKGQIYLLAPDNRIVKRLVFGAEMPRGLWTHLVDGVGVLWLCGDLREEVVIAVPGGSELWPGRAKNPKNSQSFFSEAQQLLIERATASAQAHGNSVLDKPRGRHRRISAE